MRVYPQITQMYADKMLPMDTVPNRDAEVEELWSIEAERRWEEIESGTAQTISWEEVRARFRCIAAMTNRGRVHAETRRSGENRLRDLRGSA